MTKHRLGRFRAALDVCSKTQANAVQDRLNAFARARLPALLEECFARVDPDLGPITLGTVTIDLGSLPAVDLERRAEAALREQLWLSLQRALLSGSATQESPSVEEALQHYLVYGQAHWRGGQGNLSQLLDAALDDAPDRTLTLLRGLWSRAVVRQRLLWQTDAKTLWRIANLADPATQALAATANPTAEAHDRALEQALGRALDRVLDGALTEVAHGTSGSVSARDPDAADAQNPTAAEPSAAGTFAPASPAQNTDGPDNPASESQGPLPENPALDATHGIRREQQSSRAASDDFATSSGPAQDAAPHSAKANSYETTASHRDRNTDTRAPVRDTMTPSVEDLAQTTARTPHSEASGATSGSPTEDGTPATGHRATNSSPAGQSGQTTDPHPLSPLQALSQDPPAWDADGQSEGSTSAQGTPIQGRARNPMETAPATGGHRDLSSASRGHSADAPPSSDPVQTEPPNRQPRGASPPGQATTPSPFFKADSHEQPGVAQPPNPLVGWAVSESEKPPSEPRGQPRPTTPRDGSRKSAPSLATQPHATRPHAPADSQSPGADIPAKASPDAEQNTGHRSSNSTDRAAALGSYGSSGMVEPNAGADRNATSDADSKGLALETSKRRAHPTSSPPASAGKKADTDRGAGDDAQVGSTDPETFPQVPLQRSPPGPADPDRRTSRPAPGDARARRKGQRPAPEASQSAPLDPSADQDDGPATTAPDGAPPDRGTAAQDRLAQNRPRAETSEAESATIPGRVAAPPDSGGTDANSGLLDGVEIGIDRPGSKPSAPTPDADVRKTGATPTAPFAPASDGDGATPHPQRAADTTQSDLQSASQIPGGSAFANAGGPVQAPPEQAREFSDRQLHSAPGASNPRADAHQGSQPPSGASRYPNGREEFPPTAARTDPSSQVATGTRAAAGDDTGTAPHAAAPDPQQHRAADDAPPTEATHPGHSDLSADTASRRADSAPITSSPRNAEHPPSLRAQRQRGIAALAGLIDGTLSPDGQAALAQVDMGAWFSELVADDAQAVRAALRRAGPPATVAQRLSDHVPPKALIAWLPQALPGLGGFAATILLAAEGFGLAAQSAALHAVVARALGPAIPDSARALLAQVIEVLAVQTGSDVDSARQDLAHWAGRRAQDDARWMARAEPLLEMLGFGADARGIAREPAIIADQVDSVWPGLDPAVAHLLRFGTPMQERQAAHSLRQHLTRAAQALEDGGQDLPQTARSVLTLLDTAGRDPLLRHRMAALLRDDAGIAALSRLMAARATAGHTPDSDEVSPPPGLDPTKTPVADVTRDDTATPSNTAVPSRAPPDARTRPNGEQLPRESGDLGNDVASADDLRGHTRASSDGGTDTGRVRRDAPTDTDGLNANDRARPDATTDAEATPAAQAKFTDDAASAQTPLETATAPTSLPPRRARQDEAFALLARGLLQRVPTGTSARPSAQETSLPLPASQSQAQAPDDAASAQTPTSAHAKRQDTKRGLPLPPEDIAEPDLSTDRILVENAGMVLLWPFLERFCGELGLTQGRSFADDDAAQRTPHLFQMLATGAAQTPEHKMALNKVLCGLPLGAPLIAGIDPSEAETEMIASLLGGVRGNWPAMQNTDDTGLRETFLIRQGILSRPGAEGPLTLNVAEGPFDMLLDQLPWSVGLIKLPWMTEALHVKWR